MSNKDPFGGGGGTKSMDLMDIDDDNPGKSSPRPKAKASAGFDDDDFGSSKKGATKALDISDFGSDDDDVGSFSKKSAKKRSAIKSGFDDDDDFGANRGGGFNKKGATAAIDLSQMESKGGDFFSSGSRQKSSSAGFAMDDDDDFGGGGSKGKGAFKDGTAVIDLSAPSSSPSSRMDSYGKSSKSKAKASDPWPDVPADSGMGGGQKTGILQGVGDWEPEAKSSNSSAGAMPSTVPLPALRMPSVSDAAPSYKVVVEEEGIPAREIPMVGDVLTVGRDTANDIVLADLRSSRRHLEFRRREGVIYAQDLGSGNGSYVDGEKISKHTIMPGDVVTLGNTRLSVIKVQRSQPVSPPPKASPQPVAVAPGFELGAEEESVDPVVGSLAGSHIFLIVAASFAFLVFCGSLVSWFVVKPRVAQGETSDALPVSAEEQKELEEAYEVAIGENLLRYAKDQYQLGQFWSSLGTARASTAVGKGNFGERKSFIERVERELAFRDTSSVRLWVSPGKAIPGRQLTVRLTLGEEIMAASGSFLGESFKFGPTGSMPGEHEARITVPRRTASGQHTLRVEVVDLDKHAVTVARSIEVSR